MRILLWLALVFLSFPALAEDIEGRLEHGGSTRRYIAHLPPQFTPGQSLPVVLVFHGGGGTPESAVRMTGMNAVADRHGFIAVYPRGTAPLIGDFYTWNAGRCCGIALEKNIDDVGFVAALIDELQKKYNID